MSAIVIIAYPRSPELKFDYNHYLSKHMPLCNKKWASYGLQSWDVMEGTEDSPYFVMCITRWPSIQAFETAMKDVGQELVADVPNYTNAALTIIKGGVKETWSA
ncbi:hypothetical protein HIM_07856 [Hirsutella minnesotensis 3608]|uniref:EthD domain-containing protein n=1 Tax=Hirsutella minnesotensis 3608 TaxID=1043627 RepID=A0A0F7ZHK1_9HYPO|nr:hypothetical protein HIM_07856 [Hirsutella minnesotensis 3608]